MHSKYAERKTKGNETFRTKTKTYHFFLSDSSTFFFWWSVNDSDQPLCLSFFAHPFFCRHIDILSFLVYMTICLIHQSHTCCTFSLLHTQMGYWILVKNMAKTSDYVLSRSFHEMNRCWIRFGLELSWNWWLYAKWTHREIDWLLIFN